MRVNLAARRPRGGAGARCARPGWRRAPPRRAWPLAAPETIVIAGRTGEAVPAAIAAGELTPQSRGSAAVVEVLDPQEGEHVLDLCAGPGIKTGQIADADGRPRRGDLGRARPRPRRRSRRPGAPPRPAQRHRDRGRRDRAGDGARLRPRPPRRALLGPRRARLAPRRALAQVAEGDRAPGRGPGARCCAAPPRSLRPGGTLVYSTCTISRRENEDRVAALLARGRGGRGAAAASSRTSAPARRASPRPPSRAACSCAPTAIAPPDSSSPA